MQSAVFLQRLRPSCPTARICPAPSLLTRRFLGGEGRSNKTKAADKKRGQRKIRKKLGPKWYPAAPIHMRVFRDLPAVELQQYFPFKNLAELMNTSGPDQQKQLQYVGGSEWGQQQGGFFEPSNEGLDEDVEKSLQMDQLSRARLQGNRRAADDDYDFDESDLAIDEEEEFEPKLGKARRT
eukprot:gb/GEZN01012469.1/.p1 GENE.gb/GEZN01012469.1/~~gb/GEZN01012469.1/.p1  ORF type:complete len:181 (-),score=41.72 gb/GEZN01012469.1/:463-1005(-)